MRLLTLLAVINLFLPAATGQKAHGAPETFNANAQVKGRLGVAATTLTIHVERYTTDKERERALEAMKTGGETALLAALRSGSELGYIEIGDRRWTIRYARQQEVPNGRNIVVVTDRPLFFVGAGEADPKPREGYEVAVAQFQIDDAGLGKGTMAAAARLKPGGPAGLEIADYADEPVKLVTVTRRIS